jgi:NADPH2:quinone reductase
LLTDRCAHSIVFQPELVPEVWNGIFDLLETKKCRPTVYEHVYDGLDTLPGALKELQDRKTWGKVVIRVKADPLFPPKGKSKM